MGYQVLARKWRPQNFKTLVGQEHVVRALSNALSQDRLHHAYLFTGTRGVGKTTVARIFAKCLNCETGVVGEPCGECSACREIAEGRFVDLIEIDAASRTKVEDMRELLDNVQYRPTRARFKVYLIDEVHMLSNSSFNALLKTLEEPPEHVKFLLATTDPQKLPITVLSRCLQFNLKMLPSERIVAHLKSILGEENIDAEEGALWELARAAEGSMRDALSLTDQAIAFGSGRLQAREVADLLGSVDRQRVWQLLRGLLLEDRRAVLNQAGELAAFSPDFGDVLQSLAEALHRLAVEQMVPDATDNSLGDKALVQELANLQSPAAIQLLYQIALLARRDLALSPDPRVGFEMALLRMLAFTPAASGGGAPPGKPRPTTPPSPATDKGVVGVATHASQPVNCEPDRQPPAVQHNPPASAEAPPWEDEPPELVVAPAIAPDEGLPDWSALLNALPATGILRAILLNTVLVELDDEHVVLEVDVNQQGIFNVAHQDKAKAVFSAHFGRPMRVEMRLGVQRGMTPHQLAEKRRVEAQARAEASIASDPHVNWMLERFQGSIIPNSIQPRPSKPEKTPLATPSKK